MNNIEYQRKYYAEHREEQRERSRRYYQNNKEARKTSLREYRNRPENKAKMKVYLHNRFAKNQARLNNLKSRGCALCGYNVHPDTIDFHHNLPEEKRYKQNLFGTRKWENIEMEIERCTLLCANCHRLVHLKLPTT